MSKPSLYFFDRKKMLYFENLTSDGAVVFFNNCLMELAQAECFNCILLVLLAAYRAFYECYF